MFADYIKERGETGAAWAEKLGVSRGYISEILNGRKVPSLRLAIKIARLTGDAVPAESWFPSESNRANPTPKQNAEAS